MAKSGSKIADGYAQFHLEPPSDSDRKKVEDKMRSMVNAASGKVSGGAGGVGSSGGVSGGNAAATNKRGAGSSGVEWEKEVKEKRKIQKEKDESEKRGLRLKKNAGGKDFNFGKTSGNVAQGLGGKIGQGFASRLGGMGGMMRSLGGISAAGFIGAIGVGLGAVIAAIMIKSVQAAIPKQTDNFRRDRMNKQGGEGTGWTNEQLGLMAKSISDVGTNSERTIVKSQALLLAFRNIKGDQFKQVLQLSDDVSAAMGIDMPQAAQKLGDALDDPIKAAEGGLESLGIQFNLMEQSIVRNAVKTRDYATAQDLILQKLNVFKGASAEFGQTAEGSWERLKNKLEQFGEKIGTLLIPALTWVIDKLTMIVDYGQHTWDNMGDAVQLAKQGIWVAFLELGDHCKDVFLLMGGSFLGTMNAMAAAAGWAGKKIKAAFTGEEVKGLGDTLSDAYMEGMKPALARVGKSGVVKEEEEKLARMWDQFKKKKKEQQDAIEKKIEKPDKKQTDYVNTKATFQFEYSGITDLGKKIQQQIMPTSTIEDKMNQQLKINQDMNVKAGKANDLLGEIKDNVKVGNQGPATLAKG